MAKKRIKLPTKQEWLDMSMTFLLPEQGENQIIIVCSLQGGWLVVNNRTQHVFSEEQLCFLPPTKEAVDANKFESKEAAYKCFAKHLKLD